jgi:alkylhydroperoxidase family enzyme
VDAVLADYERAPIGEPLRETLRFLEAMTLDPDALDAAPALAAGVSRQGLREAIDVAAGFHLIARYADAIGAKPHSQQGLTREQAIAHEGRFFDEGYA